MQVYPLSVRPVLIHVYGGMPAGGVRTTLFNVLRFQPDNEFEHVLLDLSYKGDIAMPTDSEDIAFRYAKLQRNDDESLRDYAGRVNAFLKREKADIVQSWGDFGNLLSGMALCETAPGMLSLIWRLSSARTLEEARLPGSPVPAQMLETTAALSERANLAIYTSSHVRDVHKDIDFRPLREEIVYNGVCTHTFSPEPHDPLRLAFLQNHFNLPDPAQIIGHSGRYNPYVKNQPGFLEAAKLLSRDRPDLRFIMCGDGVDDSNRELQDHIARLGLKGKVATIGKRQDMPHIYHLADCWASTSRSEAFPNVVLEAMASGRIVTATDTGMPELTVGDSRLIIPPSKEMPVERQWVEKQAAVWETVLSLSPEEKLHTMQRNRSRIEDRFDIRKQMERYYGFYRDLTNLKKGWVAISRTRLPSPARKAPGISWRSPG